MPAGVDDSTTGPANGVVAVRAINRGSLDEERYGFKADKKYEYCAIVLPGTRLGRNTVVGAASVVRGEFPDNAVLVGAPATVVRRYTPAEGWQPELRDVRIVVAGGGAAGTAIVHLLLEAGAAHVLVWDREGILAPDDDRLSPAKRNLAARTNPAGRRGELADALEGADVFIGVSAGNILPVEELARMADRAVVFPMANPTPEVDPVRARQYAAVVASGRSDLPNQINNVLAFPGVFRGLLDARATEISDGMLLAAADAISGVVRDDQLNANYIIPSVFDPAVTTAVAAAVAEQARSEPGATVELAGRPGVTF